MALSKKKNKSFSDVADNLSFDGEVESTGTEEFVYDGTKIDCKRHGYGETQGVKGAKLKRINMGFSDENYIFITKEAERNHIAKAAVVNKILDAYRGSLKK